LTGVELLRLQEALTRERLELVTDANRSPIKLSGNEVVFAARRTSEANADVYVCSLRTSPSKLFLQNITQTPDKNEVIAAAHGDWVAVRGAQDSQPFLLLYSAKTKRTTGNMSSEEYDQRLSYPNPRPISITFPDKTEEIPVLFACEAARLAIDLGRFGAVELEQGSETLWHRTLDGGSATQFESCLLVNPNKEYVSVEGELARLLKGAAAKGNFVAGWAYQLGVAWKNSNERSGLIDMNPNPQATRVSPLSFSPIPPRNKSPTPSFDLAEPFNVRLTEGTWFPIATAERIQLHPAWASMAITYTQLDPPMKNNVALCISWEPNKLRLGFAPGTERPLPQGALRDKFGMGIPPLDLLGQQKVAFIFNATFHEGRAATISDGWKLHPTINTKDELATWFVTQNDPSPTFGFFKRSQQSWKLYHGGTERWASQLPIDQARFLDQNLPPLVVDGAVYEDLRARQDEFVVEDYPRSGLGILPDGRVLYVIGANLNPMSLADVFLRAGARFAMQLDVNASNSFFCALFYDEGRVTQRDLAAWLFGNNGPLKTISRPVYYLYTL